MVALQSLVESIGGTCRPRGASPRILDVTLDSRRVAPGGLFCAVRGESLDGSRFIPDAERRGAAAVLAADTVATELPLWVHPEARRAAGEAAATVYGNPSAHLDLAAVTGTNGKTTVAHLITHCLAHAGRRPACIGTTGYAVGGQTHAAPTTTPDGPSLQRLLAEHLARGGDCGVLEASSHALVQERLAGLSVKVAVFTNISRDHLDYHASMEEYASAKELLFARLAPGSEAVINADDPQAPRMQRAAEEAGARVTTYSTKSRADLVASRWTVERQGIHLFLKGMGFPEAGLTIPLLGQHNIENALAAAAAVVRLGASPLDAFKGLATTTTPTGRLEFVQVPEGGRDVGVLVDFAHTPTALESALVALREVLTREGKGRLICVFGCGGDRDRGKRPEMGEVAGRLADVALVTSDNPRSEDPDAIVREVRAGMQDASAEVWVEVDRRAAIRRAVDAAGPDDLVLIAGKGHETVQIVGSERRPFDDRQVAMEALR